METWEYRFIKREILELTNINLDYYKTPQMQRRLKTFLIRSGHENWRNYFKDARDHPPALDKLKDYLTINVSSFFRDGEKYEHLQKQILPELLRNRPQLQAWSAGCSRGQEPYSLTILLAEIGGVFRQHHILATDLDRTILDQARVGGPYSIDEMSNVPFVLRQRYFNKREDGYWINENIRRQITFRQHNLLSDSFQGGFDLIICRNVVIYFTGPVKEKLYQNFYNALRPGGILFVGGTEIVPHASEIGFETAGISFYRRQMDNKLW